MSSRHIRGNLVYRSAVEKTGSGNVAAADIANICLILINKDSGAATTVTLPAAGYVGQAYKIVDAKGDAATNNITVTPASGNINGSATHVISENYGSVEIVWDGTNYTISAQGSAVSATELGFLNGVTAGTAAASKAVVLDSSSNVTGIGRAGLDGIRYEDIATISAAGTVIANATAIANRVNIVDGADDTKGVVLPATVAGDEYVIFNTHATAGLKVYPAVNSSINLGTANAAVVQEGKTMSRYIALTATNWGAQFTANA